MRFLIIDDTSIACTLMTGYLTGLGEVDTSLTGHAGLELVSRALREGPYYDLIALDLHMPELDGQMTLSMIRMLEEVSGRQPGQGARIVMVTAVDDPKEVMQSFRRQCDGYLVKPVEKSGLLAKLTELGVLPALAVPAPMSGAFAAMPLPAAAVAPDLDLASLVSSIWTPILGLELVPAQPGMPKVEQRLAACVSISGTFAGGVELLMPRALARAASAAMTQVAEGDLAAGDVLDAIGEMANMVGGAVKDKVAKGASLSVPLVVEGSDFSLQVPNSHRVAAAAFTCNGHPLVVSLYQKD